MAVEPAKDATYTLVLYFSKATIGKNTSSTRTVRAIRLANEQFWGRAVRRASSGFKDSAEVRAYEALQSSRICAEIYGRAVADAWLNTSFFLHQSHFVWYRARGGNQLRDRLWPAGRREICSLAVDIGQKSTLRITYQTPYFPKGWPLLLGSVPFHAPFA